jgi:hypothetical protein
MSDLRPIPFNVALKIYNKYNISKKPDVKIEVKKKAKYILRAHGVILQGYTFRVPKNINFITITELGEKCSINALLDKEIIEFYKRKNTIFENNDLSETISEQGEFLQAKLRQLDIHIKFKNHLGNSIANEMLLDFVAGGMVRGTGILNLNNRVNFSNRRKLYKNLFDLYNNNQKGLIKKMLLSNILTMYDLFTFNNNNIERNNPDTKLTFILMACRGFALNNSNINSNNGVLLARRVSGKSVTSRASNN